MRLTHTMAATAALAALAGTTVAPAHAHSRYGGSSYSGAPALTVTASLVQAGGGAAKYSTAKALSAIAGSKLAKAEVAKLTKQYGKAKMASFLQVGDFAVKDALRLATKAGVKLPKANLSGTKLASTLVSAGLEKDKTFNIELLLDKAITHKIHEQVMDDIDKKFGGNADANYHRISNQAFYDLGHALGAKSVKRNKFN